MSDAPVLFKKSLLLETDIFSEEYDDHNEQETATLTDALPTDPTLSDTSLPPAEDTPLPNIEASTEQDVAVDLFNMAMPIEETQKPVEAVIRAKAEFSAYMAERDTHKPDTSSLHSVSKAFYRKRQVTKIATSSSPKKSQFTPLTFNKTSKIGEAKTTRQKSTLSTVLQEKEVNRQNLLKNDRTLSMRVSSTFAHEKTQLAPSARCRHTPAKRMPHREEKRTDYRPTSCHRKTTYNASESLHSVSHAMGPLHLARLALSLSDEKETRQRRNTMRMDMSF